jgi:hypothetical protein
MNAVAGELFTCTRCAWSDDQERFFTEGLCNPCHRKQNPIDVGMLFLIDAGGEDSPHPSRIADGSAKFNMGLPPVETVVGVKPDGKPKLATRPITNHELGSNRGVREYAKRNGLIPTSEGRFRGIGR